MGKTADPVARVRRFAERHLPTIQAPGVAIGLTSREGPLGVVTVGHANLPAREPVRPEHRFQIGSISKSFTAIAVLQEHEASRLDLHAPVTEYLPWFEVRSPSGPVTLHHLLTHTAGLPTGRDFTGEGLRELWALRESDVGFAPGTRFHYSTADGTICSTAEDMCTYIRMLLSGGTPLLSDQSFSLLVQATMEDPDAPGELYGYGLKTTTVDGRRHIGHTGSTVGFSAWLETDPGDGVGVIVLTNADANREPAARFALRTLSAWSRRKPLPDIPEPTPLERVDGAEDYAGTYRSEHGKLALVADGGRLLLADQGEPVALLRQKGDQFVTAHPEFERFPLSFEREGGDVTLVTHGDRWWGNDRYVGQAAFDRPNGWEAVAGIGAHTTRGTPTSGSCLDADRSGSSGDGARRTGSSSRCPTAGSGWGPRSGRPGGSGSIPSSRAWLPVPCSTARPTTGRSRPECGRPVVRTRCGRPRRRSGRRTRTSWRSPGERGRVAPRSARSPGRSPDRACDSGSSGG